MQQQPPQPKHDQKEWLIIQRDDSNIALGILGGILGALVGAAAWGFVVASTHREFGILSIVLGLLVGYGVRWLGKGQGGTFGLLAGLLAVVGSAAGSILAVAVLVAQHNEQTVWVVLGRLNPDIAWRFFVAQFGWFDVLFYAIAAWFAWRVASAARPALLR